MLATFVFALALMVAIWATVAAVDTWNKYGRPQTWAVTTAIAAALIAYCAHAAGG